jgi:uncharacterized protein (TIGR02145 family)
MYLFSIIQTTIKAQVSINNDGSAPDSSSILDVKSTNKGFLLPRLTTVQMNSIISPAVGLVIFNTTEKCIYSFNGVTWNPQVVLKNSCDSLTYGGKVYKTLKIGFQCWMAENLNIGTRINSTQEQINNSIIEKYCYNNADSNCSLYGGLYQWKEAMQYAFSEDAQGICPDGWHIPSLNDWQSLIITLGGFSSAGGVMKDSGIVHWAFPNTRATNLSGFTALPTGCRAPYNGGGFEWFPFWTYYWSTTEIDAENAWRIDLKHNNATCNYIYGYKTFGFPVRCIKN